MVNNGTLHYDHDRDGTHTMLSGCEAKFRNKDYDTFVAIRYQDNVLKVRIKSLILVIGQDKKVSVLRVSFKLFVNNTCLT